MNKNNFEFCYVIGKGGFGKVWKIKHLKTNKYYALKEMSKLKIIEKKSENSINYEREILSKLNNPFIINMYYAFQDSDNLYLVMDYLKGGDLRFHLTRHIHFSEEQSRFFICNVLIALEYIHSQDIIHRDIKPENLVLDENGYARITDFGIAKKNSEKNKMKGDTSGTPGYMAPEIMRGIIHSFEVDFFAVGIVAYEFMKGKRPYSGKNRKEIKEEMLMRQIAIKEEEIPEDWTKESVDFINKLLVRKRENRLGFNGIKEVKEHPWIKYYPWEMILDKTLPSPFIPQNKDNFDLRYCAKTEKIGQETMFRYEEILMSSNYKNSFKDFYYNFEKERKPINELNKKDNNLSRDNNRSLNHIYHKKNKISINQSKIIIDISRDKFNTINEGTNMNKKIEDKTTKESLFINIFKKQNLKRINDLFEQKIKNNKINTKTKGKSNSNIISPRNINKILNNRIEPKHLDISSLFSPLRSDRNILRNKESLIPNIINNKKSRKKSNIFNTRYDINVNIPIFQNKNENNNAIVKQSKKCSTLLTKSNSYKIKSINTAKEESVKKNNNNKNNKSKHIIITSNLASNYIPKVNINKKRKINLSNGNIMDGLINSKEVKHQKNKSIIYRNGLSKMKINNTTNNISINKSNNNINKTFMKDFKQNEIKAYNQYKEKKDNLAKNKNKIPIKKKIINANNKSKVSESIKNILKYNPKYVALKNNNENKEHIIFDNINDKENINLNSKDINKNMKVNNEKNNEKILVNKRNKNKTIIFDLDKSKCFFNNNINNSINSTKNSYIYKYYRNKMMNNTFKTLNNNSSFLNTFGKDGSMTQRNGIFSYKQK